MTVRPHLRRYVICIPRDLQSKRIGPGQKITDNVEAQCFQNLFDELSTAHPTLAIELWDEYRLREQLQVPGNEGIRRFWFDKEEVSLASLQQAFNIAKAGWLRERYSPDLHHQGIIQQESTSMLFTPAYRHEVIKQVGQVIVELENAVELVEEFRRLTTPSAALAGQLQPLQAHWQAMGQQLVQIKAAIENGQDSLEMASAPNFDAHPAVAALTDEPVPNTLRNLKPRLLEVIAALANRQLSRYADELLLLNQPHSVVVLGRPGTGKTHGLAKVVEQQLQADLPALIIRAKGTPSSDWQTVLRSTLGAFTTWSMEEIFSGLEALAARADVYRARAYDAGTALVANEPTRLLLCVDGVDEAEKTGDWKSRMNELRALMLAYPRLRVMVSSRAYPPSNLDPVGFDFDQVIRQVELPAQGDVAVDKLVPIYLREYNIHYEQLPWLTSAFQDALSLRLFAEKYRDQDLNMRTTPIKTTLSALLADKVLLIEQAFVQSGLVPVASTDSLAKRGMMVITNALDSTDEVEHGVLCQQLVTDLRGLITRSQAGLMLEIYADHGLILQLKEEAEEEDFLAETRITYTFSFQPIVDYFVALKATRQVIDSGSKALPEVLLRREDNNALELTAVALLTDHDILIGEDGYWVMEVDGDYLNELKYHALSNASDTIVRQYLPLVTANFGRSDGDRNAVLQGFILPTLYRANLDLVAAVVHDTLLKFPSVFERDLFWAGPTYFQKKASRSDQSIRSILRQEELYNWQTARGLPLLFGWSLAIADNVYREYCRTQLTTWGLHNPAELLKLLDLLYFCGDDQIQEDLSRVLFGIASLITTPGHGLEPLAAWLLDRVFTLDQIVSIRNSVVRACGRAVVERAFTLGDCSDEGADAARSPYPTTDELLPLELGGAYGSRGERFPIVHDLAWYVIEKNYKGFLDLKFERYTHAEGEALLQRYREAHHDNEIGPNHFAMSAALAYIKSLGYNRKSGEGPGMTQDSHGALSKQGTLEEKYTWLAVRLLQGYLADLVPYERHGERYERVPDYQLVVPINNPAAAITVTAAPQWYVQADISPALQAGTTPLAQALEAWVNRKDLPDFATWLYLPGYQPDAINGAPATWRPLYLDTHLSEPTKTGATALDVSCCLVAKDEWPAFYAYFVKHAKWLQGSYFCDADYIQAKPAGAGPSVRDLVSMSWLEESESQIEIEYAEDAAFTLYKTVVKVTESSLTDGEKYLAAPARFVRQHLAIVDTDKTAFRNAAGETLAYYQSIWQEDYDRQEMLVVDRAAFDAWCERDGLKPFWIVCQYQTTNLNFEGRGDGMYCTTPQKLDSLSGVC